MFLNFDQIVQYENGDVALMPIVINSEFIVSVLPYYDDQEKCVISMDPSGQNFVVVNKPFEAVTENLCMGCSGRSSGWIFCEDSLPDESDDYLVYVGKEYSVDIDKFDNDRWKNYGKKVKAWKPFPEPPYDE